MLDKREIRESVKAIETGETDSDDKMNDDDEGVVLLLFFYKFMIMLL